MCGITGILDKNTKDLDVLISNLNNTLSHRGPDDAGVYVDDMAGLCLGHRRLSIIDLSPAGHQPMFWNDLVIVFNGEIYNYKEIGAELEEVGYTFSSSSDTEVILKAFEYWGYDCVHRFRGMFAFAIWNISTKVLTLCRDRVGVKPLYWYQKGDLFMFASELKAFHQHPRFDKSVDLDSVGTFLRLGYIPSPQCIFSNIRKLKPGHILSVSQNQIISEFPYWSVDDITESALQNEVDEPTQIQLLEDLLTESFQLRMVADVPVGILLSGGIDSSLVTAILQKNSPIPLKTYTIGFESSEYNESTYAKKIAVYLGTDHTEILCTEQEFEQLIPELSNFYDEPFGAESALPTFMVSKLARQSVTVCLSADGGDELFGGYTKYAYAIKYHEFASRIPTPLRNFLVKTIQVFNSGSIIRLMKLLRQNKKHTNLGVKISKLKNALSAKNIDDFFDQTSSFATKDIISNLFTIPVNVRSYPPVNITDPQFILSALGKSDINYFLEGHVMAKVDRATMQVALEGREPFLDHKLIEFALRMPDSIKMKHGIQKYPLRQILYKYIPKKLIERPKQGFTIPLDKWLRNGLSQSVSDIVLDHGFISFFKIDIVYLKSIIQDFQQQKKDVSAHLIWFILTLHNWYKRWII